MPSPSKDVLQILYSSPVPPFMMEAFEGAQGNEFMELPKHYLPDFSIRMIGGFPDPTPTDFRGVASHFPGCRGVSYMAPFLVVSWPSLPVKPWPLTFGGMPLFYQLTINFPPRINFPSTFGRAAS
jgi:hypothetical protein